MATVRDHTPLFGKDILSRMLDMEKLSQIQRETTPTATVLATSASTSNIPALSKQKRKDMSSPLRGSMGPPPRPLPRSTTAPNLTISPLLANSKNEDPAVTNLENEQSSPSICHSPTWSVRGKEKNKQAEKKAAKERKEQEKKMKEEEKRKAQALKPSKRLSKKPPPPAMETQRMPMALSRPSESTATRSRNSSADRSRPSSKDERRSSISSISSLLKMSMSTFSRRGSSSQPPTPSLEIFSKSEKASPQLEAMKPSQGNMPAPPKVTVEQDDEEQYLKELKEFSYQLNGGLKLEYSASASPAKSDYRESPLPSPMPPLDASSAGPPAFVASSEELLDRAANSNLMTAPRPTARSTGIPDNSPRGYRYPSLSRSSLEKEPKSPELRAQRPYLASHSHSSSAPNLPGRTQQHNQDSYVNRQRMHQQQRSISTYQEELAVGSAIANIGPHMPPTPDESTESLSQSHKSQMREKTQNQKEVPPLQASNTSNERQGRLQTPQTVKSSSDSRSKSPLQPANSSKPRAGRPFFEEDESGAENSTKKVASRLSESFTAESVAPLTTTNTKKSDAPHPEKKSEKESLPKNDGATSSSVADEAKPTPEKRRRGSILPAAFSFPKFSRSSTDPTTAQVKQPVKQPAKQPPKQPTKQLPKQPTVTETTRPPRRQVLAEPVETKAEDFEQPRVPNRSPLRDQRLSLYHEASESQLALQTKANEPELIVQGTDGDGLVRKTSVKRSRSDPELNVNATEAEKPDLDLDFLPELKHQPLVKPKRTSQPKVSFAPVTESFPLSSSEASLPTSTTNFLPTKSSDILALPQPPFATSGPGVNRRSAIKASKRATFGSDPVLPMATKAQVTTDALSAKPIAKMFVICCKCRYWHDLPSSLYEAMALPRTISQDDDVAHGAGAKHGATEDDTAHRAKVKAQVFTNVKCPWCEHGMSTGCCAGWTGIVYLHERHH